MSQNTSHIFPYAKACFELLEQDRNKLNSALKLLKDIQIASKGNDGIRNFLNEPFVSTKAKFELLDRIAPGLSQIDILKKLLLLLSDKKKLFYVLELASAFEQLMDEKLNTREIQIITANELPEDKLELMKTALKKNLGKDIRLKSKVDESLIAGTVIQTEEYVLDNSLKGRLQKMRQTLVSNN